VEPVRLTTFSNGPIRVTPDIGLLWGKRILLAWALLAPLTIPLPGPSGARLAISDVLGLITLCVLPMFLMRRGHFARLAPLLVLFCCGVASTFYNLNDYPSPVLAIFRLARWAFILSPMALALLVGDGLDKRVRDQLLDAYLAASLAGMVAGLIAHHFGWLVADAQTYDFGRGLVARATGLMGDSSAYGHLGASALALVICLMAVERRLSPLRLSLCLALLAILPLFFYQSLSRAFLVDLLVVVASLVVLAAFGAYDRPRVFSRVFGAGVALVVAIIALVAAFPVEARTALVRLDLDALAEFSGDPGALIQRLGSGRSSVWSDALSLAQSNPVLGVGYKGLMSRFQIPGDNVFLSCFAELGVIGGLLMCGLILLVAALAVAALFRSGRRDTVAAVAAPLWIGQMAHMALLDVTSYYSSFPIILLIMGLAITTDRERAAAVAGEWRRVPGRAQG
jgi:hypothetical protein